MGPKPELEISILVTVLAFAIGLVFAYAALSKARDINGVIRGLQSYKLLPERLVPLAALLLAGAEMIVAVSHLMILALPVVVPLTLLLLITFLSFLVRSVWRGEVRTCLCFGVREEDQVDGRTIARVGLLLVAEATLFAFVSLGGNALPAWSFDFGAAVLSLVTALLVVILAAWCLSIPVFLAWWRMRPVARSNWNTDPMRLSPSREKARSGTIPRPP